MSSNISIHPPEDYPWVVEFAFRHEDEVQKQAVRDLGDLAFDVVRIWLKVLTPDSCVSEPWGEPIQEILCRRRSDARRIASTWGGRISNVNASAMPSSGRDRRQPNSGC